MDAGELLGILAFLSRPVGIRIFFDRLAVAICGGILVVPLYAIIQRRSDEAVRARTKFALSMPVRFRIEARHFASFIDC